MTISTALPSAFAELKTIELPDGPLSYRQSGQGPPMVLIHGWGGSSRHWYTTMHELESEWTMYAPDLPGFGQSPPLKGRASIREIAETLIAFADALNLQQFVVVGHSFGGGVAAWLAAHWPAQVQRVVITALGAPRSFLERLFFVQSHLQYELSLALWRPMLTCWRPVQTAFLPLTIAGWSQPPLPQMLSAQFFHRLPADIDLLQAGVSDLASMDFRTALECASSVGDPELLDAMKRITIPTLLIGGEYDQVMPLSGLEAATEIIPNSRAAAIPNCGHVPMVESPRAYHQLLREFLR